MKEPAEVGGFVRLPLDELMHTHDEGAVKRDATASGRSSAQCGNPRNSHAATKSFVYAMCGRQTASDVPWWRTGEAHRVPAIHDGNQYGILADAATGWYSGPHV